MEKSLTIALVIFTLIPSVFCQEHQIVNTKSGPIKGVITEHAMGKLYTFFKIPFAKPPVGELRFKKPEPIEPWNDVIDGTQQMPSCSQPMGIFDTILPNTDVSEDCLFLNVYVPNSLSIKKSVMVWIHGGGYVLGQGNMYDSTELALTGDVIVVTINYRLNVFGFMTTWDSIAMGNYGLWDQIMALQWVKNNIEDFGGDPDSITIFGESAGGFSVSILSLLPQNKGLFHRVIAQSGIVNAPMAFNNDKKSFMEDILQDVKCDKADSVSIVKCLREVPSENFSNISLKIFYGGIDDLYIGLAPRVDNDLIKQPLDFRSELDSSLDFFRSLDYMTGYTNGEGISMANTIEVSTSDMVNGKLPDLSKGISQDAVCNKFIPRIAKRSFDSNSKVSEVLCKAYKADDKIRQGKNAVDLIGDYMFASEAIESLFAHSKQNKATKTYQYIISRPTKKTFGYELPEWFEGAPHGMDVPYLFDFKDKDFELLLNTTLTEADRKLKQTMMKFWTNFAKTGNPNSDSLPEWPGFTEAKMEYMNLNLESKSEAADGDIKRRMKLWIEDIPKIVERHRRSDVNREEL
ncbi:hypothetical protein KUTeg_018925 [Tegillarca granosa]|uniref:Carboxylic ester hydrolase n=1 Tax=Tegillarca granosa TaxID=220873 RepID=A0ABQ9EB10_TEGGR|nr:hypothetical protein KUTeg_018925 [Tegillarca granosa]